MAEDERKEHEIEASFRVRTSLRKLLAIFVVALGSGVGVSTGVGVLTGNNPVSVASGIDACERANEKLSSYAARCHEYITEAEKGVRANERVSLPSALPFLYTDPLEGK